MPVLSWKTTVHKELFSFSAFLTTFLIAFIYIAISILLPNYKLVYSTIANPNSFTYKITLMLSLLSGVWEAQSHLDFFLSLISGFLVGLNIYLLIKTIYIIDRTGKLHFSIGGATLFSLVATGCTSCGLSFLSIIGISSLFSFLPFKGLELHLTSLALLVFSIIYMLKKLHEVKYCKIKK